MDISERKDAAASEGESTAIATGKTSAKPKRRKIVIGTLQVLLVLVLLGLAATATYMAIPFTPDDTAQSAMASSNQSIYTPDGKTADDTYDYGLVFYPGAKVAPQAYAPLMQSLADQGWLVMTVDAPAHFMLFNVEAAAEPIARYSQVKHWYVGGHSLGGVCASNYASKHSDQLSGVILLASYTDADLSDTSLDVVLVHGTEDGVLDTEEYASARTLLSSNARELVIEGGNHAQFGNYGLQPSDGTATIPAAEQQAETVAFIVDGLPQ